MVDLVGTTAAILGPDFIRPKYINNLFSQFQFVNGANLSSNPLSVTDLVAPLQTSSGGGFTCIYNVAQSGNVLGDWGIITLNVSMIVNGTTGGYILVCVSFDAVANAAYEPYMLGRNDSNIIGSVGMLNLLESKNNGTTTTTLVQSRPLISHLSCFRPRMGRRT